jgi:hypothetical protein
VGERGTLLFLRFALEAHYYLHHMKSSDLLSVTTAEVEEDVRFPALRSLIGSVDRLCMGQGPTDNFDRRRSAGCEVKGEGMVRKVCLEMYLLMGFVLLGA